MKLINKIFLEQEVFFLAKQLDESKSQLKESQKQNSALSDCFNSLGLYRILIIL